MILQKFISEGLAHNSYFLSAGGEAAVIDPRRDCDVYLDLAQSLQVRITHIFETHRNEDYISGSSELAHRCNAGIYHGPNPAFSFGERVKEGDIFRLGGLELKVLETPGHTLDSISISVADRDVSPDVFLVFTGDALFAGDAGRTDFFGRDKTAWASGLLYDSIVNKILAAGDGAVILPAHGAGSVCGSDITDHEFTTAGYEKATNPLLKMTRDEFIAHKVKEHHYLPPYFKKMEELNSTGAPLIHHLPDIPAFNVRQMQEYIKKGAQVVDIRSPTSFAGGHIPETLSIWRDGIPAYAGWYLNYTDPIVLVDDFSLDLGDVIRHFTRLGYDNLAGYLSGGFPAWFRNGKEIGRIGAWSVKELHERLGMRDLFVLDVRDIVNREKYGYIPGSTHIYAGELPELSGKVPKGMQVAVYCDAGYKGGLAASYLRKLGYDNVANILGGMGAWLKAGYAAER
jgi:Zn-dependent hydrolases, including glyoxylases